MHEICFGLFEKVFSQANVLDPLPPEGKRDVNRPVAMNGDTGV
jgi:hypothetical protein